jgi:uncharacterized membrane protein
MKINGVGRQTPNVAKTKEKSVKSGSFQSILKSRLESIQPVQHSNDFEQNSSGHNEVWEMIEDAARLLDEAMEHIQKDGSPSPQTLHSLQALHARLNQKGSNEEVDAIIAAETQRLQAWN